MTGDNNSLTFRFVFESESQKKQYEDFCRNDKNYKGAIGGAITYSFTPTSLGQVFVVKNNLTGEILNLTDYASW